MLKGHGGNIFDLADMLGCNPFEITDMSSNVNPLGTFPGLIDVLIDNIHAITALPEVDAKGAIQAFATHYNIDPEQVVAANGTTQFLFSIPQVFGSKRALIFGPTYSDYADACRLYNVRYDFLMAQESSGFQPDIESADQRINSYDTVFICNPNNPTGTLIAPEDLLQLCRSHPNTVFVIDESYLPFVSNADQMSMASCGLSNVLTLNSMSKIFRIPGLRIGFLISSIQNIQKYKPFLLPWSVNSLAQVAVDYLMRQQKEVEAFLEKTAKFVAAERESLAEVFKNSAAIKLFDGRTSFVLAKLYQDLTAESICDHLAQHRILIRNCTNFEGLSDRFIRISLKTSEKNRLLAEKLLAFITAG